MPAIVNQGILSDIECGPAVNGIREWRDEVQERAMNLLGAESAITGRKEPAR